MKAPTSRDARTAQAPHGARAAQAPSFRF